MALQVTILDMIACMISPKLYDISKAACMISLRNGEKRKYIFELYEIEYNFQHSTLAFVPETTALNNILLNS